MITTFVKNRVEAAVKAGAKVTTDAKIKHISTYPAATGKNVDFWSTITVNQPVEGSIPDKKDENGNTISWKKGLTTTVTVPFGTVVAVLFDVLCDIDDDSKYDVRMPDGRVVSRSLSRIGMALNTHKDAIIAEAHERATDDSNIPSYLDELITGAKINVLTRDVKKGKVKSLFALNEKEVDCERDSVWADLYNLTGLDGELLAEILEKVLADEANKKTKPEANAKDTAFAALMKLYAQNNASNAVANL